MRRSSAAAALAFAVLAVLTGCSEEDRRAWVSILPGGDEDGESASAEEAPPPGFAVGADSTVVFLNGDTLVTVGRLPDRGPGGELLGDGRFRSAALSPDSSHVAFELGGEAPVVGVWARARQAARLVRMPEGATVERFAWSPGGAHVAWQAALAGGPTIVGAYDLRGMRSMRHPVLEWQARNGRSVRIQDWIDEDRVRLLVVPGAEPEAGLAWMWEMRGGSLMVESHVESLAAHAPPESRLLPGGVFSADLIGDEAPESVAFYLTEEPAPGALVLSSRADGFAATTTLPVIAPAALGIASWEGIRGGAELTEIVDVAGVPVLLLSVPVPQDPVRTLGFFTVEPDGRLAPVLAVGEEGSGAALFPDGRTPDRLYDLGLVDLDGDGQVEVVAAVGRQDPSTFEARLQWGAQVWRWVPGPSLEPAPGLEEAAGERLERMTAGE